MGAGMLKACQRRKWAENGEPGTPLFDLDNRAITRIRVAASRPFGEAANGS
jgi:hypothetical protein